MATAYKTPGVYIEEIPKFPPSVAPVETAIPAFIGYTQKADQLVANDLRLKPKRISSMVEYEKYFGVAQPETAIAVTVMVTQVGGVTTDQKAVASLAETARSKHVMYYALQMFFANGGGPCYIVSVNPYKTTVGGPLVETELSAGLDALKKEDEPTLIVFPEAQSLSAGDFKTLHDAALSQCADLQDRFVIMDVHGGAISLSNPAGDLLTAVENFRSNGIGNNNLKYGAVYGPNIETVLDFAFDEPSTNVTVVTMNDGVEVPSVPAVPAVAAVAAVPAVAASAPGVVPVVVAVPAKPAVLAVAAVPASPVPAVAVKLDTLKANRNQVYELAKAAIRDYPCKLPPASAMAGIYAAVDNSRGVWKAPANVSVNAVTQPTIQFTNVEQDQMNVDVTAGKSVNAIRPFIGKGTLVWGARTLAGNDNEWRYVSVRRFFIFVEESVKKATEQFVFEPNDANTWVKVQGMIENFLTTLWRQGALQGVKPEHAFYVAVGLGKTMTALDILEGRMIVEIGMAAVRPAEFIILRFSHKMAES